MHLIPADDSYESQLRCTVIVWNWLLMQCQNHGFRDKSPLDRTLPPSLQCQYSIYEFQSFTHSASHRTKSFQNISMLQASFIVTRYLMKILVAK